MPSRPLACLSAACALIASVGVASGAQADGTEIYVGPAGSATGLGTLASPLATVQSAVDRATPGTTIKILAGTYTGAVKIKTSGTAAAPIRITPAGNGPVTLTYASKPQACSNSQPAADRTITIANGADYWQIDGLAIHNGIWIAGKKSNVAYSWLTNLVKANDYLTRRAVPGHGSRNQPATANTIAYLRTVTGASDLDSADGIRIIGNTMTGRGIYGALASNGVIADNTISQIPCGIGPGIWLMTFSNNWTIAGNDISDIAISTAAHYMQEGIRLGSAADYNEVTGNIVHDLPGDGRGINTDVDASWNDFHRNTVSNVAIGYNDQMSGWGNRWEYNTVSGYRTYGFGFRLMDAQLATPSYASSSNGPIVRCNVTTGAVGKAKALGVGGMMNGTFVGNQMPLIWLSKNLQTYWSAQGNTWNGSSLLPGTTPALSSAGC